MRCLSASLDAQCLKNFNDVVGVSSDRIDVFGAQDFHESCSLRLEDPFSGGVEHALFCHLNTLLLVLNRLHHVDLGDCCYAL